MVVAFRSKIAQARKDEAGKSGNHSSEEKKQGLLHDEVVDVEGM